MINQRTKLDSNSPYTNIRRLTSHPTGMGDVYLAEVRAHYIRQRQQFNLPRWVVLKASKPENTLQDRLRKEADLLRRCRHPNVVQIFPDPHSKPNDPIYTASYTIDGAQRYQYAMEYVGKQSAAQLLEQKGRLGVQETLRIGIDIARALEHIHAKQMLNLDIKPSNIVLRPVSFWHCLLGRTSHAVLCDFGTARLLTDRAHNYGTDGFASPEQAQESPGQVSRADQRSDLFSLGATLYTLLNGEPPCAQSALYAASTIEPLSHRNAQVSAKLSTVINKALAVDPNQRYQTATELRQALERHVRSVQIQKCQITALLCCTILWLGFMLWPQLPPKLSLPDPSVLLTTLIAQLPNDPAPTATRPRTPLASTATFTPPPAVLTSTPIPLEATSTRIAAVSYSATPTETPTPTPSTATPAAATVVVINPVVPVEPLTIQNPKPGDFIDGPAVVHWRWSGKLAPNQAFEIEVWHDLDRIHYGAVDAKLTTPAQTQSGEHEYEYVLNFKTAYSVRQHGGTEYNLAVAIVQIDPYQFIGPASAPIRVQVAN